MVAGRGSPWLRSLGRVAGGRENEAAHLKGRYFRTPSSQRLDMLASSVQRGSLAGGSREEKITKMVGGEEGCGLLKFCDSSVRGGGCSMCAGPRDLSRPQSLSA